MATDTPCRALKGELWGVYCEDLGNNWPRYNGTALYIRNKEPGGRLNKKDGLTKYGDSHVKDKT